MIFATYFLLFSLASDPPNTSDCDEPSTPIEIARCNQGKLKVMESEMVLSLDRLVMHLDKISADSSLSFADWRTVKKKVLLAQSAWTQYRENECSANYLLHGIGSMRWVAETTCRVNLTQGRMDSLRQMYDELPKQNQHK